MTELKNFTFGFVGLGLMGGSLAKGIRANILDTADSEGKIYAMDISKPSLDQALDSGIIDKAFSLDNVNAMLAECDLVYICLYPKATLDFLKFHFSNFKDGAIVTDISGVKNVLVEGLKDTIPCSVDFILGHPMAGNEREGYFHSSGEIFDKRNYILMPTPKNKASNIKILKDLVTALGFTRVIETDYKVHDHKIAFTSQLCHVIASALVESAEDEKITAFGGGSYEDLTRIALINAPLWTELFLSNKDELLCHIETFEKSLEKIKTAIQSDNASELESILSSVRSKRMSMLRIDSKL